MKVRDEVLDFSVLMEKVLQKNDYKGHWITNSAEFLFYKLVEEVGEVGKLLALSVGSGVEGQSIVPEEMVKECVDIANLAMMLASKFEKDNTPELETVEEEGE